MDSNKDGEVDVGDRDNIAEGINDAEKLIDGQDSLEKVLLSLKTSGKIDEVQSKITQYRNENNVEEIFRYFWRLEEVKKYLSIETVLSEKSQKLSLLFIEDGEKFLQKKLFSKALDFFNQSILYAPHKKRTSLNPSDSSEDECLSNLSDLSVKELKTNNDFNENKNQYILNEQVTKTQTDHNSAIYNPGRKYEIEEILPLGYACRASALFHLKQYELCLLDIERIIGIGCPKSMLLSLIGLKKNLKSLMMLQDQNENDMKCSTTIIEQLNSFRLSKEDYSKNNKGLINYCEKSNRSTHKISSMYNGMYKAMDFLTDDELVFAYKNIPPPTLMDPNPNIPSFNSSLMIQHSEQKGRHIVATRDIKPGELLAVEKAYTWNIDMYNLSTIINFCSTCLVRCAVPLPCPNCPKVVFCSDKCRETGLSSFHRIECEILPTISDLNCVSTYSLHLVMNIIAKIPYNELKRKIKQIKSETQDKTRELHGFNNHMIYDSSDYQTIYHLEGNLSMRSVGEILNLCEIASIIVQLLIKSEKYFVSETGESYTPNETDIVLVGSVCVDHLSKILCNTFDIYEYEISIMDMKHEPDVLTVGYGVFPACSMFSHSCNPTAHVGFNGTNAVFHSLSYIPAGGEVTITYNKTFEKCPVIKRKKYLFENYFFICDCVACVGDWETDISKEPKLSTKKLIKNIGIDPTTLSLLEEQLNDVVETFQSVVIDMKEKNHESSKHLNIIKQTLEFFDKYVEQPSHIYYIAQCYLIFYNFGLERGACRYVREKIS